VLGRVDAMRAMVASASLTSRRRFVMGYVASTIYARLPALIRQFRKLAPEVDLHLVEIGSIEQIAALKDGKIDVGFGRIRFEDPAVRRTILREEKLVLAVPADHVLAGRAEPVTLAEIARFRRSFTRGSRASYADQVISHFQDFGLAPVIIHEARELQSRSALLRPRRVFA
jgi:DNA-binding transcriptional LysR family regulator